MENSMSTIKIGNEERLLEDADPQWVNQQINNRKSAGESVCVRITIREGDLNLNLATPNCSSSGGGGGGRAPTTDERRIFDLWARRGLDEQDFSGGNVVSFIKQLQNLL